MAPSFPVPRPDVISVVERAYDLAGDDGTWRKRLLEAVQPLFDYGMGTVLFTYDVDPNGRSKVLDVEQVNTPMDLGPVVRAVEEAHEPSFVRRVYMGMGGFGSGREICEGLEIEPPKAVLTDMGQSVPEIMGMTAGVIGGSGMVVAAPMVDGRPSTPAERARWFRVLPHLRAGIRLRRRARATTEEGPTSDGDAVLSPDGKVLHAEPVAQEQGLQERLRDCAVSMDRARSVAGRKLGDDALDLWRGLVDGRWSLVDRFDRDGRRLVIARRNDPLTPDPRRLTKREFVIAGLSSTGASNKEIAYELDSTESAVATALRSARQKLQANNRVDLQAYIGELWEVYRDEQRRKQEDDVPS